MNSMNLQPTFTVDSSERRQRAVARLASTGDVDAVARAFDVTRAELLEWVAEATGKASDQWDDFHGLPTSEVGRRPPVQRRTAAKPADPPHTLASAIALVLGALPLPAWPMMALWAAIGGFVDRRAPLDSAIFGWTLVSYPFVYVPCLIAWVVFKRRAPTLALCFAAAPCVQILVCVAASMYGLAQQTGHH